MSYCRPYCLSIATETLPIWSEQHSSTQAATRRHTCKLHPKLWSYKTRNPTQIGVQTYSPDEQIKLVVRKTRCVRLVCGFFLSFFLEPINYAAQNRTRYIVVGSCIYCELRKFEPFPTRAESACKGYWNRWCLHTKCFPGRDVTITECKCSMLAAAFDHWLMVRLSEFTALSRYFHRPEKLCAEQKCKPTMGWIRIFDCT